LPAFLHRAQRGDVAYVCSIQNCSRLAWGRQKRGEGGAGGEECGSPRDEWICAAAPPSSQEPSYYSPRSPFRTLIHTRLLPSPALPISSSHLLLKQGSVDEWHKGKCDAYRITATTGNTTHRCQELWTISVEWLDDQRIANGKGRGTKWSWPVLRHSKAFGWKNSGKLYMPDCWLEVSIRKVLRPASSTQGFLAFPWV
jgi:hypothetical protein